MYCFRAVVSEDAKTKTMLASGLQTWSLERESNTVSQCVKPWIKFTPEYPFKEMDSTQYYLCEQIHKWSINVYVYMKHIPWIENGHANPAILKPFANTQSPPIKQLKTVKNINLEMNEKLFGLSSWR